MECWRDWRRAIRMPGPLADDGCFEGREFRARGLARREPFQKVLGLRLEAFDAAAQHVVIRCPCVPHVEWASGTGQAE